MIGWITFESYQVLILSIIKSICEIVMVSYVCGHRCGSGGYVNIAATCGHVLVVILAASWHFCAGSQRHGSWVQALSFLLFTFGGL